MSPNSWFKIKRYPHIGLPINQNDQKWIEQYIMDSERVAKHSFTPFIHITLRTSKFRKEYDEISDSVLNNQMRKKDKKSREIYYADHFDSNIYSYYAHVLGSLYEDELKRRGLSHTVTAYRKIVKKNSKSGMSNIDFAEEVFEFIRSSNEEKLVAMTFDISSFFDNLDHKKLKECWKCLLKCDRLPNDQYNVYRNITRFSYIDIEDLFHEFHNDLIAEKRNHEICTISVSNLQHMKNKHVIAFCKKKDFHNRIRRKNYIKANKFIYDKAKNEFIPRQKGIPQGSPISSILANLYLLEFDSIIQHSVNATSGLYRRYSDDIVVVCKEEDKDKYYQMVIEGIQEFRLLIQPKKSKKFLFVRLNNRFECYKYARDETINQKKRFEYLGFEFDGKYSYLKSNSLAGYYRKMKKAIRRCAFYAFHTKYPYDKGKIFRRKLYRRFSYLGAGRKLVWHYNIKEQKWVKTKCHDWGNYLTYANKAYHAMKESKVRNQISRHWTILNELIRSSEERTNTST